MKKWPLLEEIELIWGWCSPEFSDLCQTIGLSCPRLKHFRLNELYSGRGSDENNSIANCIGRTMPNLRSLQLTYNMMTNEGLHAILEGCPLLKSLDVRMCRKLTIDRSIMRELEKINNLRLPEDSSDNCKFCDHVRSPFCSCFDW
ncbi:F-box protein family-like [Rhynchospora pubera]|uniref:F-box protein family-like n=1 Tax=Rhynchospora pubera TaxID=906938 RepID=A0AAV8D4I7_9POAL|nr:F-box protein family-like [Rhynchospora pubera]